MWSLIHTWAPLISMANFRYTQTLWIIYMTRVPKSHSSCSRGWVNIKKQTFNNKKTFPFYRIKKYYPQPKLWTIKESCYYHNTLPHLASYARLIKSSNTTRARVRNHATLTTMSLYTIHIIDYVYHVITDPHVGTPHLHSNTFVTNRIPKLYIY